MPVPVAVAQLSAVPVPTEQEESMGAYPQPGSLAPPAPPLTYFLLDGWRQGSQELRAHFGHTRIPHHCRS